MCDSVSKLFAQARGGLVFDVSRVKTTEGSRILSARVVYGEQKERLVVEGDEQDFKELVRGLKNTSAWHYKEGGLHTKTWLLGGSCTLEVRAVD
jgi:hypothetical protein